MFGENALKLIKIMGHSGTVPGALGADEVAGAREKLQAAVDADKELAKGRGETDDEEEGERRVSLAQRALPLLEMLDSAAAADAPVMWDK